MPVSAQKARSAGVGLGAVAAVVAGDEGEAVEDAGALEVGPRRYLVVIGGDAEGHAGGDQPVEEGDQGVDLDLLRRRRSWEDHAAQRVLLEIGEDVADGVDDHLHGAGDHRARRREAAGVEVEVEPAREPLDPGRVGAAEVADQPVAPDRPGGMEVEERAVLVEDEAADLCCTSPSSSRPRAFMRRGAAIVNGGRLGQGAGGGDHVQLCSAPPGRAARARIGAGGEARVAGEVDDHPVRAREKFQNESKEFRVGRPAAELVGAVPARREEAGQGVRLPGQPDQRVLSDRDGLVRGQTGAPQTIR